MKKGISYFGTRDLRWVKKDLDEIKKVNIACPNSKNLKGF